MAGNLDRTYIEGNILDRIDDLEKAVHELKEYGLAPQAATESEENPGWATLSGWAISGTQLRDIAGRIILDSTVPSITIDAGGYIQSDDFVAGTSGFQINGGTAEFNDVVIRGTIYATVGQIGGWTIGATDLTGGDVTLSSTGYILVGPPGNDIVCLSTADRDIRLYAGNSMPGLAPFRVTKMGALTASNADITGTIDANAGHIGALDVDGLLTVGTVAPLVQIDGPNKRIRTSDYVAGVIGWNIDTSGAEFANVRVRGSFQASVFEKSTISAVGGSWIVAKSAATIKTALVIDNAAVPFANTAHLIVNDPPAGGWLFDNNDIIRVKAVYSGGVADTWVTVTRTATTNEYDITVNNGTVNYTIPAGTGCVDYGPSGQGFFAVSADGTLGAGAAWVLGTHAGAPWAATTAQVWAGTDGQLYAGGGDVVIGENGLWLSPGSGDTNMVRWINGTGHVIGQVSAAEAGGNDVLSITAWQPLDGLHNSVAQLNCDNAHLNLAGGVSEQLNCYIGGAFQFQLDSTKAYFAGKVCIGTTTATYKLNVMGATQEALQFIAQIEAVNVDESQTKMMLFGITADNDAPLALIRTNSSAGTDPKLGFSTGSSTPMMLIDNNGKVGIGTTAPLAKLAINGGLHVGGDSDPGDNTLVVDSHAYALAMHVVPAGVAVTNYQSEIVVPSGADRSLFIAAVSGVSDGFTIQYTHATTSLNYTMNNGILNIPSGTVQTALGSAWDLGAYAATAPAATGYVTIKIGGTTYKLLAST